MNGKEIKYKDATFYNEAVIAYRDKDWGNGKHYTPNAGYRRDIAVTVKTYEDLCIWIDLINSWGYWREGKWHKRSPTDFKGLLTCFEFKQREHERQKLNQQLSAAKAEQEKLRVHRKQGMASRSMGRVSKSVLPIFLERQDGQQRRLG